MLIWYDSTPGYLGAYWNKEPCEDLIIFVGIISPYKHYLFLKCRMGRFPYNYIHPNFLEQFKDIGIEYAETYLV